MGRGSEDEGIAEPDDPILSAVNIHLREGAQDGDGRDEAARDGHGGGEQ